MPFKFKCPSCGVSYNVKDKLAGEKTKCQKCGDLMTLTPPANETSESGSPIYRHFAREREFEPAHGDGEAIDAISDHFEKHVGHVESVFHEIVSDMIHVDVHWIAPTAERPWHVLFTTGMSERPMTVPDGAEASDYAELVLCLPGEWPISDTAFKNDNHYWPVGWLKYLARLPHEYETWLGWGHTIPSDDPPKPFADNTGCVGSIMLTPPWFGEAMESMVLADGRKIEFLSPIPLYQEEMDLKLKKGAEALFDRWEAARIPIEQLFDPARKNSAKKRFGLF